LMERGIPVTLLVGSPSAEQVPLPPSLWESRSSAGRSSALPAPFAALEGGGIDVRVATDDGTAGFRGLVSELFDRVLAEKPGDQTWAVYGCGPWGMLRSIAKRTARENLFCQVSLEEMMACGIGACQACVVKVYTSDPPRWEYKLCCTHGPVFPAEAIVWD